MQNWKFTPTGNHLINFILVAVAAVIIIYNHSVSHPGAPITIDVFAPLIPGIGQWVTSLTAHRSASSKFISVNQVLLIIDLAREKGADPYEVAEDECGVELRRLTRKQASQVIAALKRFPRALPAAGTVRSRESSDGQ